MTDPKEGHSSNPDSSADLEQRLEAIFARRESGAGLSGLDEAEDLDGELLELLAINDFVEEGLEMLASRGGVEMLDRISSGRLVGDYRLLEEIGSGGMGVLYLARDETLGRLVAVKLLSRSGQSTEARFLREAEITASLSHPNIVEVYARGESEGVQFIAMRFVAGRDPLAILDDEHSRDRDGSGSKGSALRSARSRRAVRWSADIARALHHAHERGVVHRDIKPGNVLVEDDHPFVLDFGLAKSESQSQVTRTGDLLGTVSYMSPEQIRGESEHIDRRTDIYSLGAALYQLLVGSVPFDGKTTQIIARQILHRDPPTLRRFGIDRDLEAIVMRAMEKSPEHRYATASEFADDLERWLASEPVQARHLGPMRRGLRFLWRRRLAAAAVFLIAAGLGFAVWSGVNARRDQAEIARTRLTGARTAAARGDYAMACRDLESLLEQFPDHGEAARELARLLPLEAYDELMKRATIKRLWAEDEKELLATADRRRELIRIASTPEAGEELRARVRVAEVTILRREGRYATAAERVAAWEADELISPRAAAAFRLYLRAHRSDEDLDPKTIEAILALPSHGLADDFALALTAGQIPGVCEEGLRSIDRFLQLRPEDYWARFVRGSLLSKLNRPREAVEVYGGIIASMSDDAEGAEESSEKLAAAYYQRGLMQAELRRYDASLADLERSTSAARGWELSYSRAHVLRMLGRFDEAVEAYRESLAAINADHADASATLKGEGRDHQLRRLRKKEAGVKKGLGLGLVEAGQFDEAVLVYESLGADERFGEDSEVALAALEIVRGEVAAAEGRIEEAARSFRAASHEIEVLLTRFEANADLPLLAAKADFNFGELYLRRLLGGADPDSIDKLVAPDRDVLAAAFQRLAGLLEEDPTLLDVRYLRAEFGFRYLLVLDRLLFNRKPRGDDLSKGVWDDFSKERLRLIRQTADDLGFVRESDRSELALIQDPSTIALMRGVVRYWNQEAASAVVILGRLVEDEESLDRARMTEAQLYFARALEESGQDSEALGAYRKLLGEVPDHDWAATLAARVAGRLGDVAAVLELFELMKTQGRPLDAIRAEFSNVVYDAVRAAEELKDFRTP